MLVCVFAQNTGGIALRASLTRGMSLSLSNSGISSTGWGVGEELRRDVGIALLDGITQAVVLDPPADVDGQ